MIIERAFIHRKVDKYHYYVRIPSINKSSGAVGATPDNELYKATVCTPPGVAPSYRTGCTVCVAFEDNDISSPIILGLLFNERFSQVESDISPSSLSVGTNVELPENITVGNVTFDNIKTLEGLTDNLSERLKQIDLNNDVVDSRLLDISNEVLAINSTIDVANSSISTIESRVTINTAHISYLSETQRAFSEGITAQLHNHVADELPHIQPQERQLWNTVSNKADQNHQHNILSNVTLSNVTKLVLGTGGYGTANPPSGATKGQIYFKLEE